MDEETGLYFFEARYYDQRTSVWLSADPILGDYLPTGNKEKDKKLAGMGGVFVTSNLGLYTYVANNPLNFTDPTGLYWFRQDWQPSGVVGHPGTIVPPGGLISEVIEQYVPAGYTFGEMHDSFVGMATDAGLPDLLVNRPLA